MSARIAVHPVPPTSKWAQTQERHGRDTSQESAPSTRST